MNYTLINDIRYGDRENNLFNIYIPDEIDKSKEQGIVICIHGGGWNSLIKEDMDYECRHFAGHGYLAATIGHTFIKVTEKDGQYYTGVNAGANLFVMLEDIELAIKKIKEYMLECGFNVTRLALSGVSSGGHLAMLYAFSRKESSAIPISFVCNAVGPADLGLLSESLPNEQANMLLSALCGKEINESNIKTEEIMKLISSVSPVKLVDKNSPPTLSAYGAKDPVVPKIHRDALKTAFDNAGVAYECVFFPDSSHDLGHNPECRERFRKLEIEFAHKYFDNK